MEGNLKEQLVQMINDSSEKDLAGVLETARKMHLSNLLKQQKQIEQEIAKRKRQLKAKAKRQLKGPSRATKKPAVKRRSRPRMTDVIRQTLRDAGGPLPLSKITEAVSRKTNRPLTDGLRSYVSQLIKREPAIRRLSRGLYGITL